MDQDRQELNKILKIFLAFALLAIGVSSLYYYLIYLPKLDKDKIFAQDQLRWNKENNLNNCLEEADKRLKTMVVYRCTLSQEITIEERESCERLLSDDAKDIVGVLLMNEKTRKDFSFFIEQRKIEREECFKEYPQK